MEEEHRFFGRFRLYSSEGEDPFQSHAAALNRISPELFGPETEYRLSQLFGGEADGAFAAETARFDARLRQFARKHASSAQCLTRSDKPRAEEFKRNAAAIVSECFDAHFTRIFPVASLGPTLNADRLLALSARFFDFAFAALNSLVDAFRALGTTTSVHSDSLASISSKRVWSAEEQNELFELLERSYPARPSADALRTFAQSWQRTYSAVANKAQKLRRRCVERALGDAELFATAEPAALEGAIQRLLERRGRLSYDEILAALEVGGDVTATQRVDSALYALLNRNAVRCEEVRYIELAAATKSVGSPILNELRQFIAQCGRPIALSEARCRLLTRFPELDPETPHFDRELEEYISASPLFALRKKRTFFHFQFNAV